MMLKTGQKIRGNHLGQSFERDFIELKQKLDEMFVPSSLKLTYDSIPLVGELVRRIEGGNAARKPAGINKQATYLKQNNLQPSEWKKQIQNAEVPNCIISEQLSAAHRQNTLLHQQILNLKQKLLIANCEKFPSYKRSHQIDGTFVAGRCLEERYQEVFNELTQLKYKYNELMDMVHQDPRKDKVYIRRLVKHKRYSIPQWLNEGDMQGGPMKKELQQNCQSKVQVYSSTPHCLESLNSDLKAQVAQLSSEITLLQQRITLRDQQIQRLQNKMLQFNGVASKAQYDVEIKRKNQRIKFLEEKIEDLISLRYGDRLNPVKSIVKVSETGKALHEGAETIQRVKSLIVLPKLQTKQKLSIPNYESSTTKPRPQNGQHLQSPRTSKREQTNKQNNNLANITKPQTENSKKRRTIIDIHSPKKHEVHFLQQQLNVQQTKIEHMSQTIAKYERELSETTKKYDKLYKSYDKLSHEHQGLLGQIKELSVLNEQLKHEITLKEIFIKDSGLKGKAEKESGLRINGSRESKLTERQTTTTQINYFLTERQKPTQINYLSPSRYLGQDENKKAKKQTTAQIIRSSVKSPRTKPRLPTEYEVPVTICRTQQTQHSTIPSPSPSHKLAQKPLAMDSQHTTVASKETNLDNYQIQRRQFIKHGKQDENKKKAEHEKMLEMEAENMFLREENGVLVERAEAQKRQRSEFKKKLQMLQRQLKTCQQNNTKVNSGESNQNKPQLLNQIQIAKQRQAYQKQLQSLSSKTSQLETANKKLSEMNTNLRMEMGDQVGKLQKATQQLQDYKQRTTKNEAQAKRLALLNKDNAIQLSKQQQVISSLETRITHYKTLELNFSQQQSNQTVSIQELINKLSTQQQQNIQLKSALSKTTTSLDHLKSELQIKHREVMILAEGRQLEMRVAPEAEVREIQILQHQVNKLREKYSQVVKENQLLTQKSLQDQHQIDSVKTQLALKSHRMTELQRQVYIFQNEVKRLQQGILQGFQKDSASQNVIFHVQKQAHQLLVQNSKNEPSNNHDSSAIDNQ